MNFSPPASSKRLEFLRVLSRFYANELLQNIQDTERSHEILTPSNLLQVVIRGSGLDEDHGSRQLLSNLSFPVANGHHALMWIPVEVTASYPSQFIVQVAGFNSVGIGPFSDPKTIQIDPRVVVEMEAAATQENYAWLVVLFGSVSVVLLFISMALLWVKGKIPKSAERSDTTDYLRSEYCSQGQQPFPPPPANLMEASTLTTTTTLMNSSMTSQQQPMWLDRRWNPPGFSGDDVDSDASDKMILNNNSENEYAYIDRKSLSTFVAPPVAPEPEPYATTDLIRSQNAKSSCSHRNSMERTTSFVQVRVGICLKWN